jgi:hypothetical protein
MDWLFLMSEGIFQDFRLLESNIACDFCPTLYHGQQMVNWLSPASPP